MSSPACIYDHNISSQWVSNCISTSNWHTIQAENSFPFSLFCARNRPCWFIFPFVRAMQESKALSDSCSASVRTVDTSKLSAAISQSTPSYLGTLTKRSGGRPKTLSCLPHSQLSDTPKKEVFDKFKEKLFSSFEGSESKPRHRCSKTTMPLCSFVRCCSAAWCLFLVQWRFG